MDLLEEAIRHHLRNDFSQASALYVQCVTQSHKAANALLYLGILFLQNGHREQGNQYVTLARNLGAANIDENLLVLNRPFESIHQRESTHFSQSPEPYSVRIVGNVNDWRHCRMLDVVRPFTEEESEWLTIGDHYGHDALRLLDLGASSVIASSLSTDQLEKGRDSHRLSSYLAVNAEAIPLRDGAVDYVVCKEALHHMPRPYQAVYEMLRVARKAVFVVAEPSDPVIDWRPEKKPVLFSREFYEDKNVGPAFRYLDSNGHEVVNKYIDWWETGPENYVYTVSEREFTKLAQGYGLPSFATGQLNDFYNPTWVNQPADGKSEGHLKTMEQIALHDRLCESTGIPKSRVHALLFRETPSPEVIQALEKNHPIRVHLTRTRYLPLSWPRASS